MRPNAIFPEHFGRNLDALWDVLSADIEGPIEVVRKNPDSSRLEMGGDFDRILAVLLGIRPAVMGGSRCRG